VQAVQAEAFIFARCGYFSGTWLTPGVVSEQRDREDDREVDRQEDRERVYHQAKTPLTRLPTPGAIACVPHTGPSHQQLLAPV
jgi:hypothetical protein